MLLMLVLDSDDKVLGRVSQLRILIIVKLWTEHVFIFILDYDGLRSGSLGKDWYTCSWWHLHVLRDSLRRICHH